MKVLLKKDVENLGYAGEVHNVTAGYVRNYLLPRGLAVQATPGVLKAAEAWRERAAARRAELQAEYAALAERINDLTLAFTAKAGETGKLYGSVTTNDVADRMNEELGTAVDRRKVVGEPLRQLGTHQVLVKLSRDVQAAVTVRIESDVPIAPVAAADEVEEEAEEVVEEAETIAEEVDEFEDEYADYEEEWEDV